MKIISKGKNVKKILVITVKADSHADHLTTKFTQRKIPFFRLNTDHFSKEFSVSCLGGESGMSFGFLERSGVDGFHSAEIKTVWHRKPLLEEFASLSDANARAFSMKENEAFFNNFYASMRDARWVNHPHANRSAGYKLPQLALAKKLGFAVPDTLVTNSGKEFGLFYEKHQKSGVIYKTLNAPFVGHDGDDAFRSVYTTLVRPTPSILKSIEVTPCIFQEYIEKAFELRITVVGERVFSERIYSQDDEDTKVDWRRGVAKKNPRQEVHRLDSVVERLCVDLVKSLGLRFGTVDVIVTPSGEHVFLELNPNGQWLWKELLLGLPISEALIDEFK